MGGREDQNLSRAAEGFARNWVDHADAIDGVAEHLDACDGGLISRLQFDGVAAHPKIAAAECNIVAFVLQIHQSTQNTLLVIFHALVQLEQVALVLLGVTHAINAAHRCHHNHIATSEQCFGGRVAQPVNLVVDRRVLFNKRVTRGDVRLGLVIVVVTDEIFHPIVREEFLHLLCQLGSQTFVRGQDQSWALQLFDRPGNGRRLARTGDAEQSLKSITALHPQGELSNGLWLVTGRLVVRDHLKFVLGARFHHAASLRVGRARHPTSIGCC